ncbi:MAG: hypothetical protein JEZ02_20460 [Desulfatibacillum sp.]|nr:hypothetical protein [Desulfatibacillum sp.]
MSSYNEEQANALAMARNYFAGPGNRRQALAESLAPYLAFRQATDRFLEDHFADLCTVKCYQGNLSACCSREGIVAFFADVVINAAVSSEENLDRIAAVLARPNTGVKCVFLTPQGCLWKVKPIVCQMFVCNPAKNEIFEKDPALKEQWENLKKQEKTFTWPDKPVLFDDLETLFMDQGLQSPLMYCHNSPGLLMVKKKAGLK